MDLNTVVNVCLFVITFAGMVVPAIAYLFNRRQVRDEGRLSDAEKLTSIALNSTEMLRKDLSDAKTKTFELETEIKGLRNQISDFETRVTSLEHVYNDLVTRQHEFLLNIKFVENEAIDILHGKITSADAAQLVRERFNIK